MKNLKIIPFLLVGIYILLVKCLSNASPELKIAMGIIMVVVSSLFALKFINSKGLEKNTKILFVVSILISIALAVYFAYL